MPGPAAGWGTGRGGAGHRMRGSAEGVQGWAGPYQGSGDPGVETQQPHVTLHAAVHHQPLLPSDLPHQLPVDCEGRGTRVAPLGHRTADTPARTRPQQRPRCVQPLRPSVLPGLALGVSRAPALSPPPCPALPCPAPPPEATPAGPQLTLRSGAAPACAGSAVARSPGHKGGPPGNRGCLSLAGKVEERRSRQGERRAQRPGSTTDMTELTNQKWFVVLDARRSRAGPLTSQPHLCLAGHPPRPQLSESRKEGMSEPVNESSGPPTFGDRKPPSEAQRPRPCGKWGADIRGPCPSHPPHRGAAQKARLPAGPKSLLCQDQAGRCLPNPGGKGRGWAAGPAFEPSGAPHPAQDPILSRPRHKTARSGRRRRCPLARTVITASLR